RSCAGRCRAHRHAPLGRAGRNGGRGIFRTGRSSGARYRDRGTPSAAAGRGGTIGRKRELMPAYIGAGGQICIVPIPGPSAWGYRKGRDVGRDIGGNVAAHWDDCADNARGTGYHCDKVQSTGRNTMRVWLLIAFTALMSTVASAQQNVVVTPANIEYVQHDGVKLTGD